MEVVCKEIEYIKEREIMYKLKYFVSNKLFMVLSFLLFSFNAIAQEKQIQVYASISVENTANKWLVYHPQRALDINDFRGNVQKGVEAAALIYSGVSMSYKVYNTKDKVSVFVKVSAYMDPNQSWMRKTGKNKRVLEHEQKHFDLTALAACQLVEKIKNTQFTKSWRKELRQLYAEEIELKLQRLQNRYDQDTVHGTNRNAQKSYNEFIENQLEQSECFP